PEYETAPSRSASGRLRAAGCGAGARLGAAAARRPAARARASGGAGGAARDDHAAGRARSRAAERRAVSVGVRRRADRARGSRAGARGAPARRQLQDRKSTRLNSSHLGISYAVFCLKKKKHKNMITMIHIATT